MTWLGWDEQSALVLQRVLQFCSFERHHRNVIQGGITAQIAGVENGSTSRKLSPAQIAPCGT
jgi:hypothetical protein